MKYSKQKKLHMKLSRYLPPIVFFTMLSISSSVTPAFFAEIISALSFSKSSLRCVQTMLDISEATKFPLPESEYITPCLSSSAYAFCIVFGFIASSDARARTEGKFSSGFNSPRITRSRTDAIICSNIGVLLRKSTVMRFIGTPPFLVYYLY